MTKGSGRIQAFDWLRGIAVLVMVQTHAVPLLLPALKFAPAFRVVNFIDGLVAPAFLFAAGFSLSLVQVRGAALSGRFWKSLQRVGEVLLVATLLNALWFPVLQQPHWLYRLDILHCLGLSLLIALPVSWALARRPALVSVALGLLAIAAFAVAPFGESVTGWQGRFFNEASGSTFPLLPWCGHVFVGAALGAFAGAGRTRLAVAVACCAVAAFGVWTLTPWLTPLYPTHVLWRTGPGPHALRFAFVAATALMLMGAEVWIAERLRRVRAFVDTFGQNSLAAYVFHLLFLFYEPVRGASFRAQWAGSLDFVQLSVATVALVALTWFAVHSLVVFQRAQEKRIGQPTSPREAPLIAARSE